VTEVQRLPALVAGAAAGALAAAAFLRKRRSVAGPEPARSDPRAAELRQKLAEARRAAAEEDEVEAAERVAETSVAADPPAAPPVQADVDPPRDEFEAMRRRVHDEARAAAEEMRRSSDEPSTG
jgi:hypothetical protein